jgi:peptide/nickel transport system substrate-binding protein
MQPRLALAEFAEPNADASSWTLRLKPGLEFHHGKTIDADDLIFSIRRLTDPQLASPYAALLHWVDRDNLVKLDDRTVRLGFREGRSYLPLKPGSTSAASCRWTTTRSPTRSAPGLTN